MCKPNYLCIGDLGFNSLILPKCAAGTIFAMKLSVSAKMRQIRVTNCHQRIDRQHLTSIMTQTVSHTDADVDMDRLLSSNRHRQRSLTQQSAITFMAGSISTILMESNFSATSKWLRGPWQNWNKWKKLKIEAIASALRYLNVKWI